MEIMKQLYVLLDIEGYVTDYIFSTYQPTGWVIANEVEVNEKTMFSKLVDGKFVLDEDKWEEYQSALKG